MPQSPAEELPAAQELCDDIIASISSTSLQRFAFQAPVIDRQTNLPYENPLPASLGSDAPVDSSSSSGGGLWKNGQHKGSTKNDHTPIGEKHGLNTWCQTEILGWNRFISGIEKQKAHLDHIAQRPEMIRESPLPSVQSSATLWKQILIAHTPVTGVRCVMRTTGDKVPPPRHPSSGHRPGARIEGSASPRVKGDDSASDGESHGGNGDAGKMGKRQTRRAQRLRNWVSDNAGSLTATTGRGGAMMQKKAEEVVIDVVARGGAEWIKIYTKKESQLLAEFREQDSYLCSDFDSESDSDSASDARLHTANNDTNGNSITTKPKVKGAGLRNSIIDMARSILHVAHLTPCPPGADPPVLTMRFTRMTPTPHSSEPRIGETYDVLREMGVRLVFGDLGNVDLGMLTPAMRPLSLSQEGSSREGTHVMDGDDGIAGGVGGNSGTNSRRGVQTGQEQEKGMQGQILPSLRINLDPTALVGLCCDLLHHPLHTSIDEARRRYFRPRRYLHDETGGGSGLPSGDVTPDVNGTGHTPNIGSIEAQSGTNLTEEYLNGYDDLSQSQHSRELFKEAIEEARAPLIEEMRNLLGAAVAAEVARGADVPATSSPAPPQLSSNEVKVEWYATPAALRHLKEAMGNTAVVGLGREQMRMRRLIGLEGGDFWEGSRYEGKEGVLRGIRVRELPDRDEDMDVVGRGVKSFGRRNGNGSDEHDDGHDYDNDTGNDQSRNDNNDSNGTSQTGHIGTENSTDPRPNTPSVRSFHLSLSRATSLFLSEYRRVLTDPSLLLPGAPLSNLPPFLRPDRLPVPKVASLTLPLPIVSLMSMQRGAEEGMTTLSMGNVVFRELWREGRWRCRGWTQSGWELERARERDEMGKGEMDEMEDIRSGIGQRPGKGYAVVWLMPYRSLGEGKRVRFEAGDYAFPASLEQGEEGSDA